MYFRNAISVHRMTPIILRRKFTSSWINFRKIPTVKNGLYQGRLGVGVGTKYRQDKSVRSCGDMFQYSADTRVKFVECTLPPEYKLAYKACKVVYTVTKEATSRRRLICCHDPNEDRRIMHKAHFGDEAHCSNFDIDFDVGSTGSSDIAVMTNPHQRVSLMQRQPTAEFPRADPFHTVGSMDHPSDPTHAENYFRYGDTESNELRRERYVHGGGYVTINPHPHSVQHAANEAVPDHLAAHANHSANVRMRRHGQEARDRIANRHEARNRAVDRGGQRGPAHVPAGRVYCHCPTIAEVQTTVADVGTHIGEGFRRLGEMLNEWRFLPATFPFWLLS